MKNYVKFLVVLLAGIFVLCFTSVSCSNGSDSSPITFIPTNPTNQTNGGTESPNPTNPTTSGTGEENGGQQQGGNNSGSTPITYTITFNENNGNQNPRTKTQIFTEGTAQNLKTITELGFLKNGSTFAGWGIATDSTQALYLDGASYIATKETTLYALWSDVSVYTVRISDEVQNGDVTAIPTIGTEGMEITLSNTPNIGCQFVSYIITDEDLNSIEVENGKFTMPAKNVIVKAIFNELSSASGAYNVLPTPTDGTYGTSGTYVTFGLWPQTIKVENILIDNNNKKNVGAFTYYKGSDGEWYAKFTENACESNYKYSDGITVIGQSGTNEKYFKVEPIKWRILSTNYNGKKLLVAENILAKCEFYDVNYSSEIYDRRINGEEIQSRDYKHSRIRAFLNGISYEKHDSNISHTANNEFLNKGFLQTAFNDAEQMNIVATNLSGYNITDKIFLLSKNEVTTTKYGFVAANKYVGDSNGTTNSTRIRKTTDCALACGTYDGYWWLRTCDDIANIQNGDWCANYVWANGRAENNRISYSSGWSWTGGVSSKYGVIPALCLE